MEEIFKELYSQYKYDVYRLAYSFTGNKNDAEDITQKVFIKLYKKLDKNLVNSKIKNWLLTVTSNECKDFFKSFWKSKTKITSIENLNVSFIEKENDILSNVNKLPKKYRICIHLFYYYGYSAKEIAKIEKTNLNTIKTRLRRGRELLKLEMEDYNEKN